MREQPEHGAEHEAPVLDLGAASVLTQGAEEQNLVEGIDEFDRRPE